MILEVSGGVGAAGCFDFPARGDQGARGLPRCGRMGARWEARVKAPSVYLVPCRYTRELEQVGGLVGNGWGLQPEREQGPLWSYVE